MVSQTSLNSPKCPKYRVSTNVSVSVHEAGSSSRCVMGPRLSKEIALASVMYTVVVVVLDDMADQLSK